VASAAMLAGAVAGGVLGTGSLAWPYYARIGLLAAVFLVAYRTMFDVGFSPRTATARDVPREMERVARESLSAGWRQPSLRLLMVMSLFTGLVDDWAFYAWQPYVLELLGRDLPWVAGVIAALAALATMGGNRLALWETHRAGRRTTLMMAAAVAASIALVGMGLAGDFGTAVLCYLAFSLAQGLWTPVKQAYMHQLIPSAQRATVISFDSLIYNSGSTLGQPGLGQLAERRSIGAAYVAGGLITAGVWPLVLLLRRRDDPQDRFAGGQGTGDREQAATPDP